MSNTPDLSKPYCWYVPPDAVNGKGEYIPSVVVAGEQGHWPTDYRWGKSLEIAEKCAAEMNERLGITPERASEIVASSMFRGARG